MAPKRKSEGPPPSDSDDSPNRPQENESTNRIKRTPKETDKPIDPTLPINKTFPEDLDPFPRPKEGSYRLSAYNLVSLKSANSKGLKKYIEAEDPDILFFSETKLQAEPNSTDTQYLKKLYEHRYWGHHPKAGYAGVGFLTKIKPENVTIGLPGNESFEETKGRMITLEFKNAYVIGTYVPNSGVKLKNLESRKQWNEDFEKYIRELDALKPVIWIGDMNVAPTEKDLRLPKSNWNKTAGFTEAECNAFKRILDNEGPNPGPGGMVDVWRHFYPDVEGHYTYYSKRYAAREKGIGWRLDHVVVSERLVDKVVQCEIRYACYGPSDHVPLIADVNLEL